MVFETHFPSGILSKYIDSIVFFEGYTAEHRADKLMPDGGIYLIINMLEKPGKLYKNEDLKSFKEFNGCFISGQHNSYIFIEADHSSNMAIKFKLGGAAPFFNFPIAELNNKVQQVENLLEIEIQSTRKKIIAEKEIGKKFELIEKYLENAIRKEFIFDPIFYSVLEDLSACPDQITVKKLADKMNISQKHLITLFNKQVGLNPKALIRIFRFQKVILELEKQNKIDWMQVSTDCGYYDQAHFIKDFYNFSGIKPSGYNDKKGEYLNYIPVQ